MSAALESSAWIEEAPRPTGSPRLLEGLRPDRPLSLDEHLGRLGPLSRLDLISEVESSGLRGRGGAGFPTGRKLRAVAGKRGRPVIVANGTEAEPISGKDKLLLRRLPHLVLDGVAALAAALGAREGFLVLDRHATAERAILERAIEVRARRGLDGRVELRLADSPGGFVSGEETAVVNLLNGRQPKPTFKPPLPFERGVGGAPTLVQNVETLAHAALIARRGARWFREVGTAEEPGSALISLSGAVQRPGVYEVALGSPLTSLLAEAGGLTAEPQAFLVGGYFGAWISEPNARGLELSETALRPHGASLGAGAVVVLPASACGLAESARVTRYLASASAGQCGPCVYGLDAVAGALEQVARPTRTGEPPRQLGRWLAQVRGRGACRHPDGTARFASSALAAFEAELELHLRGRCSGGSQPVLPAGRSRS
jgi:NADH:ubiquinone oxidoreductase subunit F (NADH-binding)